MLSAGAFKVLNVVGLITCLPGPDHSGSRYAPSSKGEGTHGLLLRAIEAFHRPPVPQIITFDSENA